MFDHNARDRGFARAAASDGLAGTLATIRDELFERLLPIRIQPKRIVDLGSATGAATRMLAKRYPGATIIGVDRVEAMARRTHHRGWLRRGPRAIQADLLRLPLADASVDLLYSSLAFQWVEDPAALFRELRRVLRPDGVLLFATLGPDSLTELRTAWSRLDEGAHVQSFIDMHDLGDAMLGAGLRDPVMDVDHITSAHPDIWQLIRRIRQVGSRNILATRARGLTGRRRMASLGHHYPRFDHDSQLLLTWEIVYGHAWGASAAQAGHGDANEFHVPISAIGRRNIDGVS